jgi:drug/metabolite transporter (DMT)-like permease
VTGVLLSALALGEPLTPTLLFGMAGILGGIAMVHLSGGRARRYAADGAQAAESRQAGGVKGPAS